MRRLRHIISFSGADVGQKILGRADELKVHTNLGPEEKNLVELGQGHRSLLVGTLYKIVYLVDKPIVLITDIFDVRQDPNNIKL